MIFEVELTDTFGGAPNFSWVRRGTIEAPRGASRRMLVRRAKVALGLSGRHSVVGDNECIELRFGRDNIVAFIYPAWEN